MASGPKISGNLEKSGNFVPLEKSRGKVRKFREIQKSQGILLARHEYRRRLFKIHSSGGEEIVTSVHVSCMLMNFYLRIKMKFKLWNNLFFFFLDQKVFCY